VDREALRRLDVLLFGQAHDYSDEQLDAMLPFVQLHLDALPALRALPLAEVPNALVAVAGGRK
jgi:hypothetical protein